MTKILGVKKDWLLNIANSIHGLIPMKLPKQTPKKGLVKYDHENDGIDHINIHYYASNTELGRQLSHFSRKSFNHPQYGPFNSLEAFWWWIAAESPDDEIRRCSADKARTIGRLWSKKRGYTDFNKEIFIANYHRIDQNDELKQMFIKSNLPFTYYYLHGTPPTTQINDKDSKWMVYVFEELRRMFKNDVPLDLEKLPEFLTQ